MARPPLLPWSKDTWERWASIPRLHKAPIMRTKFLLSKAPVSTLYEEKFNGDRNMFTVSMYASRMTALGTDVGMVIDCTALDIEAFAALPKSSPSPVRYFHDVNEWQEFDIEYVRIPSSSVSTESSSTIPSQLLIDQFLQVCSQHWTRSPDTFISVFDSRGGYGVASYLICCYMCVHLKAPIHSALASLEKVLSTSTGTGLLDIDLIRDLQQRFHGTKEISFDSSKIPSWWWPPTNDTNPKLESEPSNLSKNVQASETVLRIQPVAAKTENSKINNHARKRSRNEESMIPALEPLLSHSPLYQRAKSVLDQLTNHQGFWMEEQVLTSSSAPQLYSSNQKYKVSWISQGRRGLLLILSENIYFIEPHTTTGNVDQPSISLLKGTMNFPLPDGATPISPQSKKQHRTLLEVVLVQDIQTSMIQHRFMIRDILAHNGGILWNKPFHQRLKYIMEGVIQPRKRDTTFDYSQEPIHLRAYEFFDVDRLDYLISEVCLKQQHDVRGIFLIPLDGVYFGISEKKTLIWMNDSDLSKTSLLYRVMGNAD